MFIDISGDLQEFYALRKEVFCLIEISVLMARRFNYLFQYFFFLTRLTPVYAIILGFVATLLVYTGSGPGWALVQFESDQCRQNWWTNLLYINNLLTTPNSVRLDAIPLQK